MVSLRAALTALGLVAALLGAPRTARAEGSPGERAMAAPEAPSLGGAVPELTEPPDRALVGKPIRRVDVVVAGGRWTTPPVIKAVRVGEPLSLDAARRAMREVLAGGHFARANVESIAEGDGAVLRLHVLPRRLIARVQISGAVLDISATLDAAEIGDGGEITAPLLAQLGPRVQRFYAQHGFPAAVVLADTTDTDDPGRVVVSIQITPGAPQTLSQRIFVIDPRLEREVGDLKSKYRVAPGARLDEPTLADADREHAELLRQKGFLRAEVHHRVTRAGATTTLTINLDTGPRLVPAFDGNRAFDSDQLTDALDLEKTPDGRLAELTERLRAFYVARGFYDAEITAAERGVAADPVHHLVFSIRERPRVRVTKRLYPCLPKELSPDDVGSEIDSFLTEDLPSPDAFSPGNPRVIEKLFGPIAGAGGRSIPPDLNPVITYAPETYERAIKHLRDVYHSKGYLNAIVGPISAVRGVCRRSSPADACLPEPRPALPSGRCLKDSLGLPLAEPVIPDAYLCRPDPAHNIECSPDITLRIPIALGPQMTLYDLAFEGNRSFSERDLGKVTELPLGDPLSNVEVESARIRLLDTYRLRGFAYAEVRAALEPSPDRTRARVRFTITERERVFVEDFVIKGNKHTETSIILRRLMLRRGGPYQQDLVRQSEERLATLGVFSSVAVALEDPDVPQRRKRVVITVVESGSFALGTRLGFSTGEGVRFGADFEGRNIGGLAISFALRLQLGYLPDFLILDEGVRQNFGLDSLSDGSYRDALPILNRLERRNTISLTFPEIGLSPAFSLSLEGIDVRHNQRDFGLAKDAVVPTLSYRPRRGMAAQLSVSAERNDVQIFNQDAQNGSISIIRAPEGLTLALSQRATFTWDLRDNPFNATRGMLFSTSLEHVNAFPLATDDNRATNTSHFLRFTGRFAAYFSLPRKLVLAMSLAAGYNLQLSKDSKTYPDRLSFLGGVDSLRSFLADSLVPEDLAERIVDGDASNCSSTSTNSTPHSLSICDVGIRGGDLMVNPRAELRIPLTETFQAGLFLDTGNVWTGSGIVDILILRYALGAGLRIATPIGPIAFDYGINMNRRRWEDIGAFHFSIGLF